MKMRVSVFLVTGALLFMMQLSAQSKKSSVSEQTSFSAEDSAVERPVAIPDDVMAILREDKLVRSVLESENVPPELLPSSWFSASAVRLGEDTRPDLIIVGGPPVSGGNVANFWVFHATPDAHQLVMSAPAHDLSLLKSRHNRLRDIKLVSMSAVQVNTSILRFDGKQYVLHQAKSELIR